MVQGEAEQMLEADVRRQTARIRWDGNVPKEVADALRPIVEFWQLLLPTWVQEARVVWIGAGDNGNILQAKINYKNRWAFIRVGTTFLMEPEDEREDAVLHELAHVIIEPLMVAVEVVVDSLMDDKNSPLHRLSRRTIQDAEEAAVEDMARCIRRLALRREWDG